MWTSRGRLKQNPWHWLSHLFPCCWQLLNIYIYIYINLNTLVFKSHHKKNQNIANVCCSDYDYICLSSTFFTCKHGMFIYVKSKNHLPGYLDKNSEWRESLHHSPPTATAIYPHIYTASKPRISSFANNTRHIKIFLKIW